MTYRHMDVSEELVIGSFLTYVGVFIFLFLGNPSLALLLALKLFGLLLIVIGVILLIYGIIVWRKQKKTIQPILERNCLNCGKAIPFDAIICPYCKFDFEKNIKI